MDRQSTHVIPLSQSVTFSCVSLAPYPFLQNTSSVLRVSLPCTLFSHSNRVLYSFFHLFSPLNSSNSNLYIHCMRCHIFFFRVTHTSIILSSISNRKRVKEMKTQVRERFSEFFNKWICQLDGYLQQLLSVSKESCLTEAEQQALVSKLTAHYKEFYTIKWAAAHEDVLSFYCPVWFSKLENAYSWLTGWKPSMIFRLVESMRTRVPGPGLAGLTEEQLRKIEQLRMKIKLEEEKVEREMERQQVAMAGRKMVELVRMARRIRNAELVGQVDDGMIEVALKGILAGLERVMKAADCVRLKTLKGVLDVLNPSQSVDFLAGTCMLQIQLRQWGQRSDSQKGPRILELQYNNVHF